MNKFVLLGAAALMFAGLTSCHDDDPGYTTVVPTPPVAPNSVSGLVTDLQGEPVQGATVKIGSYVATTNEQGYYTIPEVADGTYAAQVSAPGMVGVAGEVVVSKSDKSQNVVWSVALAREVSQSFNVTVNAGGKGTVESEAIKGNDKGEIKMDVAVSSNIVPKNTTITITPIYTEESAKIGGRAVKETLLIGANITCSDPNLKLSSPIDVNFNVDQSVVSSVETKQYLNGKWQAVNHSVTANGIVVSTKEFAPIGLFFKVNVTKSLSTEAVTFPTSKWDNLYGTGPMNIGNIPYTYKVGSEYKTVGANTLEALLIEYVARLTGPVSRSVQGSYPLNMNLLIGQAVEVSGRQAVENLKVSAESHMVSAKSYGAVSVTAIGYTRDHNGSGS